MRFQEGDINAYNELVKRYKDRLFNFVLRYFNNAEQAEDVVQDTLIKLYTHASYYKNIAKPFFTFGPLTQSCTLGDHGTRFYALQRALHLNGSKLHISTYHISFAYRLTQFSNEEMDIVRRETAIFDRIDAAELDLQIWHCQDINAEKWYQVSM